MYKRRNERKKGKNTKVYSNENQVTCKERSVLVGVYIAFEKKIFFFFFLENTEPRMDDFNFSEPHAVTVVAKRLHRVPLMRRPFVRLICWCLGLLIAVYSLFRMFSTSPTGDALYPAEEKRTEADTEWSTSSKQVFCGAGRAQVEFTRCDRPLMQIPGFWTLVDIDKSRLESTRSCLLHWKRRLYELADEEPRAHVVCAYHLGHTAQVCVSKIVDLDFFANLVVMGPFPSPTDYLPRYTSSEDLMKRFGPDVAVQVVELSDANLSCVPPVRIYLPDTLHVSYVNTRGIATSRHLTQTSDIAALLFVYLVHTGVLFES